jgi:hypothetical protein
MSESVSTAHYPGPSVSEFSVWTRIKGYAYRVIQVFLVQTSRGSRLPRDPSRVVRIAYPSLSESIRVYPSLSESIRVYLSQSESI